MGAQACHTRFDVLYMAWGNVLCFDEDCHFNFENLEGSVYCIGGKNGYGKTSFLETIAIALFGECFPSRMSKQLSSSSIISMHVLKESATKQSTRAKKNAKTSYADSVSY